MASLLIVGYGNPLRADDGIGWRAAEELSRTLASPNVEVLACHQLTPELVDLLKDAETVFFIDAAQDGRPGEITCHPVTAAGDASRSHYFSPESLLRMTQRLHDAAPKCFMVSICGECFDLGTTLSDPVEAALPRLITLIEQLADQAVNASNMRSLNFGN